LVNYIEGKFNGENKKISIIVSRFNSFMTDKLLDGALDCLKRHGVNESDIRVIRVPGAFEIPAVCRKVAFQRLDDAVIALGAVIRGDTPHFDYVANEVSKGISAISLETGIPVIFGVLTTDTIEQAEVRSGAKGSNKGFDAALTALEMINLFEELK
jgi:6,7-dimethyl-8-ribityllumazine synthase